MPGFYVNHLKSHKAKEYATQLEMVFANPVCDSEQYTVVTFDTTDTNALNDVLAAGYAVLRDHPEFFYYNTSICASATRFQVSLKLRLLYSLAEIKDLQRKIDVAITSILSQITSFRSNWEKEKYIFEYLQTHTDYVDDDKDERFNILGPLLYHQSVCEGISKAFAVLCHRIGVHCIVAFSSSHMWNIVNIDGKIANVDATFGANSRKSECDYTYFNVPDSAMSSEHVKELDCMPKCIDSSCDYYSVTGNCYPNSESLQSFLAKALLTNPGPIHVKLANGSIEKAIRSIALFIPQSFYYRINEKNNTATISICNGG